MKQEDILVLVNQTVVKGLQEINLMKPDCINKEDVGLMVDQLV